MIILAPKMQFSVPSDTKSIEKAKKKLLTQFKVDRQENKDASKEVPKFTFNFEVDCPIGLTFSDLYEIYNSIPKNLMDNYEEGLKLFDDMDPQDDKDFEKVGFFGLRLKEFENFIEDYLNNIRKEEELKIKELVNEPKNKTNNS